ncbi:MAG TPA: DUF2911 domain-containing protein [Thermoanaerobaculia bacterium]|jgi:hypothetical protein|nr:DUF2911 domain-containing protein [Thermoanaerobaculia bacterium]
MSHRPSHASRTAFALAALALCLAALPGVAQTGPPRPSPNATVSQVAGFTKVSVAYSSPGVKGRPIWGALVPYGKVWRSGANEATSIELSTDVTVEGKPLPAGKYALFTIPGEGKWTVIFNKTQQWGAFDYKEADDALRVEATPRTAPMRERLAYLFEDTTDNGTTLVLAWEKLEVPVRIFADTPKMALARAEEETAAADVKPNALINWARWLQQHDLAADKALAWVQRATATEQGAKSYWGKAVEARLLAQAGKIAEAKAAAAAAVPLAPSAADSDVAKADAEKLQQEAAGWK